MSITSTTPEHVSSSTLRVRRYRERRRKGVRCLTVEMYEADIAEAATRSLLRSDGDAWNVLDAWYASHLSEAALQWLVDNRVIVILLLLGRARMLRPDAFPKINIGPAHAHDFTGTCPVINNSRMMFATCWSGYPASAATTGCNKTTLTYSNGCNACKRMHRYARMNRQSRRQSPIQRVGLASIVSQKGSVLSPSRGITMPTNTHF